MPGWKGWASLGGQLGGGPPAIGRNADGRLEVFALGPGVSDVELWHLWQHAQSGTTGWSAWDSLGSPPAQYLGVPTVAENADGRLEAFARVGLMSAGVVWHRWQEPAPQTGWSAWSTLGAPPGGVSAHILGAGRNADGRLEIFAFGEDGNVWHVWQNAPLGTGWSPWASLGTPPGVYLRTFAVGQNADGRLEVFGVGLDNQVWHAWQESAGGWSGWDGLGAPPGATPEQPAVGLDSDGHLGLFVTGNDGNAWHIRQEDGTPNGWGAWEGLGGPPGSATTALVDPVVATNQDGRLELFANLIGSSNGLWHAWQEAGGGWSGWASLGGEPESFGVGQNPDGRLEAFATTLLPPGGTAPRVLWHRWQVAPNSDWSDVSDWELTGLGVPVRQLFVPVGGRLYARAADALHRSDDGGDTWIRLTTPTIGTIAAGVDPTNGDRLFVGDGTHLYRSTDGGASWTQVLATVGVPVMALAVSPADPSLAYMVLARDSGSFTFLRSEDGGSNWTVLEGPLQGSLCFWTVLILEPHPTDPQRIFRASGCYAGRDVPRGDSLDQSLDRGATFAELFHSVPLFPLRLVGGEGAAPSRFYLASYRGGFPGGGKVFRSDDDGSSWEVVHEIPSGPRVNGLAYHPDMPDRAYVGISSGEVQQTLDAGAGWAGIGRSGLGILADLALSPDGSTLFAATEQGVWRIAV